MTDTKNELDEMTVLTVYSDGTGEFCVTNSEGLVVMQSSTLPLGQILRGLAHMADEGYIK